ncbi:iron-sulfur cluster assembly scaffold protein [Patescibacteria group bacterium]|nr:iron-sulfur cluster assembly scaffold protein [Patescibacteria group bacterium]MBU1702896.1 iron-sulfur cluster assembly scaffold protein [Patescibacteria group bacterium]MBU1954061.1 iron-sulfur cluster assembly scaffold protein [Patescibacteria group bacterium]
MDMYAENILDHYKNPRRFGRIADCTHSAYDVNPLCGDCVEITLTVDDGVIVDAAFSGKGCAISRAATSMLMEEIVGRRAHDVGNIANDFVFELIGAPLTAARVKCALLGLVVLKKAVNQ